MRVDLSKLITSYDWEYSVIGLSRDGEYFELRDSNHVQYLVNTTTGKIKIRSYYEDYLFLNYRVGENFFQLKDGNLYIPNENGEGNYSEAFNKPIDDSFYVRGIIFSEIDYEANRLILVSRCPNSLKEINNDYYVEEYLNKYSGSFHWYRRPQENEQKENSVIIGIFDLKGNIIKSIFLQSCDASPYYMTCECSLSRKELLLFSNEHTFRVNYITNSIIGLYEGESVNFINDDLLGHWGWMGYDSFFGGELILNNTNEVVAEIDMTQFCNIDSGNFWIYKTVEAGNYIYFINNYPYEADLSQRRIFRMKINNWNEHQSTDLLLNENERLLAIVNNVLYTYSINDEILLINEKEIQRLTFNDINTSVSINKNDSTEITKIYSIDIHTKSSISIGQNKFQTQRTQVGELLYRFKYCFDFKVLDELFSHVLKYFRNNKIDFDVIIPVPPSNHNRPFQPVFEIAKKLSSSGFIVDFDFLVKKQSTPAIKKINDPITRKDVLKNVFEVKDSRYKNKKVLLFDDLFRSGETLTSIARVLKNKGLVSEVTAFTITKTRTKQ
jgi:adenine/guanine phosphoribosyltransferase-like PRPP-binding protein